MSLLRYFTEFGEIIFPSDIVGLPVESLQLALDQSWFGCGKYNIFINIYIDKVSTYIHLQLRVTILIAGIAPTIY